MTQISPWDAIIVGWSLKSLSFSLIFFRVFTRVRWGAAGRGRKRLMASDYLLLATVVLSIISGTFGTVNAKTLLRAQKMVVEMGLQSKFGTDPNSIGAAMLLKPAEEKWFLQSIYVTQWLNSFNLWLVKGAFLALYFEVTANYESRLKTFMIFTGVYTALTGLVAMLIWLLWCQPVSSTWDLNLTQTCFAYAIREAQIVAFSMNISSDCFLIAIPMTFVFKLGLFRRQKLAVICLAVVAMSSVVASCIKFGEIFTNINNQLLSALMTDLEAEMGKIALCLPACRTALLRSGLLRPGLISDLFQEGFSGGWGGIRSVFTRGNSQGSLESLQRRKEELKNQPPHGDTIELIEATVDLEDKTTVHSNGRADLGGLPPESV